MGIGNNGGFMVVVERGSWGDDEEVAETHHAHFWGKLAGIDLASGGGGPHSSAGGVGGDGGIEAKREVFFGADAAGGGR